MCVCAWVYEHGYTPTHVGSSASRVRFGCSPHRQFLPVSGERCTSQLLASNRSQHPLAQPYLAPQNGPVLAGQSWWVKCRECLVVLRVPRTTTATPCKKKNTIRCRGSFARARKKVAPIVGKFLPPLPQAFHPVHRPPFATIAHSHNEWVCVCVVCWLYPLYLFSSIN